ncbi:carbohydrate sulfotransferase 3 [Lingula anatina]|uniref:Carbohydrate sulfotransferase 3 n=1 Tax=Lingula anatina TaxID=7574 RepID=A0A1S3JH69_LINAN|nr:carbohydrate sulfotransferase 3 [Lingula anatina]|eukprot:XP_013409486.1 carbohydrate sulfotransferase 3 [Lingula anatina]
MPKLPSLGPTAATRTTDKVMILAYYRSGSSFLGELFNNNPSMFYLYEPLWNYQFAVKYRRNLTYCNGTSRMPPVHGNEFAEYTKILDDILNCRIRSVPLEVSTASRKNEHGFLTSVGRHKTLESSPYYKCLRQNKGLNDRNCIHIMEGVCKGSKVKVIKTIRFEMWQMEDLLLKNPGLKVIHLLRDPRGQITSVKRTLSNPDPDDLISKSCMLMLRNLNAHRKLDLKFPGRITQVFYEDLAISPFTTAKMIYDFIGMELPSVIEKALYERTMAGKKDNGVSGTTRKNSTLTAHAWVNKIDPAFAHLIDDICTDLHDRIGVMKFDKLREKFKF